MRNGIIKYMKNYYYILILIVFAVAAVLIWKFVFQPKETEQLIGGQTDGHGCLIAAGYSWCQAKQKCLRTWEEECPAGLIKETLKAGTGEAAKTGDKVSVHYTGTLLDGTKFDSSVDRGTPFSFTLGANRVIAGWEQGVLGMKVGEKRKLTIPPELGYGAGGVPGAIPGNATLIFEVELLGIN
jgi:hypothetical protein